VTLTSEIELPELDSASSRTADISIELAASDFDEPVEWFHTWHGRNAAGARRRRPWLSFARHDDGYRLRFPDLADFDVSRAGDRIRCRPVPRLAPSTLRHLILDQVLTLTLSQRGHLVLHASAVHVPGVGAIAFAGPSGSGKSTLAAALCARGCQTVTDDCLVVTAARGVPTILPGYPGVRLWKTTARALGFEDGGRVAHYTAKRRLDAKAVPFRNRPSPLKALFVLGRRATQGRASHADTLDPRDRLMAVARYAYLLDVGDRDQLSRMFSGLSSLVSEVAVRRLRLRDARRQPLRIADEVLDLLAGVRRDS
jgi:hypothetical protein